MDPINYLLILVALVNLWLAVLIIRRSKKLSNIVYAAAIITVILWVVGMILYRASEQSAILFNCKLLYAFSTLTASSFLFFTIIFPYEKTKSWKILAIFGPNVLLFVYILFSNGIINSVIKVSVGEPIIHFGSLYLAFSSYISLYFFVGFYNLVRRYFKTDGLYQAQIKYIFLGYFIASNLAMTTNMIMPYLGNYTLNWLGQFFSLIMVGFTTYAIIRYRLLNIRFVLTRSLVYLFLISIISSSFILASSFAATFFHNMGVNFYFVWIAFAFVVVLTFDPLKNLFASLTDQIFYKNKINYGVVLKHITKLVNEEVELERLVHNVEMAIVRELKLESAQLLLRTGEHYVFLPLADYMTHRNLNTEKLDNMPTAYFDSPLIKYLKKEKHLIVTDELERYIYDLSDTAKQHRLNKVLHNLQELKVATAVAVMDEHSMIALLTTGNKASGEVFSNDDVNLLEVLSQQLAAAVERSKLYQEVQEFNKKLQLKVNSATHELVEMNGQLQLANEHLKELDAAKSEFMSIASHQLRTPLAGIIGYMSMILEGDYGKMTDGQQQVMQEVYQASQRLVRLVNTFLNVTRIEAGRFTLNFMKVDLIATIRSEIKEMLPTAQKKNLELHFEEPNIATLEAMVDVDKIRDVFLNLVDNAIKYTQAGTVTVRIWPEGKMARFSVGDTGVGIEPKEAANLFQKFVRGSNIARVQPDGSGLGLYIVKKIVEGHNGKIWANSAGLGQGTIFHVMIPLTQATTEYHAAAERIFEGKS